MLLLKENKAKDKAYGMTQGYGGAIYYDDSDCNEINNVSFYSNSADYSAGAIYYFQASENLLNNSVFINNTAEYNRGGAIAIEGNALEISIVNSRFEQNNASLGAAISYVGNGEDSNIINSTFIHNCAYVQGSALYVEGHSPKLTNCTLLENKAKITAFSFSLNSTCTELQIIFYGGNNQMNAIYSNMNVIINNVTYWGENGITVSPASDVELNRNSHEPGQNISYTIQKDGNIVRKSSGRTNGDGNLCINTTGWEPGTYKITAIHYDDEYYYYAFSTKFERSYDFIIKDDADIGIDIENNTYGLNASVDITLPSDIDGKVTVNFNDNSQDVDVVSGKASFTLGYLPVGDYNITVYYAGNSYYFSGTNTVNFTVVKAPTTIQVANYSDIKVGEDETFDVAVGPAINGEANVFINDDLNTTIKITEGKGKVTISNLANGTYTLKVIFIGNENYTESESSAVVKVFKHVLNISGTSNDADYGEDVIVNVVLNSDVTGFATVTLNNGQSKTVDLTNGVGQAVFKNLNAGNYIATITHTGDAKYQNGTNTTEFKVSKISTSIDVSTENINYGSTAVINVTLSSNATGNVSVEISNRKINATLTGGKVSVPVSGLNASNYDIIVTYGGDNNYLNTSATEKITVNKVKPTLIVSVENIIYGNVANGIVTLPEDATGKLSGIISYNSFEIDDNEFSISNLDVGKYLVYVIYEGNNNYEESFNTTLFEVYKANPSVDITVKNIYVGDNESITVTLPKDATGSLNVTVNGVTNTFEANGEKIVVNFTGLKEGSYDVIVNYTGDGNYNSSVTTKTFKVSKIPTKITTKAVTYKTTTKTKKLTATLKDKNGNVIAGKYVTFKVNGKTYKVKTNSKGVATVNVKLTTAKTYKFTVTFAGDSKYAKSSVTSKVVVKKVWNTVSYGSKATTTVKKIQKALKSFGFYIKEGSRALKVDGIYHKYTVKAVKQFQKAKGLKVTGKVDEATAKKLKLI